MRRMIRKCSSKWEPNWVRRYGGSQTNQGEVLNNYCYMISTLKTLCFKNHIIIHFINEKFFLFI